MNPLRSHCRLLIQLCRSHQVILRGHYNIINQIWANLQVRQVVVATEKVEMVKGNRIVEVAVEVVEIFLCLIKGVTTRKILKDEVVKATTMDTTKIMELVHTLNRLLHTSPLLLINDCPLLYLVVLEISQLIHNRDIQAMNTTMVEQVTNRVDHHIMVAMEPGMKMDQLIEVSLTNQTKRRFRYFFSLLIIKLSKK